MTVDEVLTELEPLGSAQTKKVLTRHGAREPFFGVKIEDLQKIRKRIKVDHELALALYDTGVSDAMYLAGLIADDARMTKRDLRTWARQAYWYMIAECTVPWVATGNRHGPSLAAEWTDRRREHVAACGWSTFASLVSVKADEELDLDELRERLDRIRRTIHAQPNRVRYTMNGLVIAIGCYVPALHAEAIETAEAIGEVTVEMGETSCKVPFAPDYILKVEAMGRLGRKRKTAKC